MKSESVGKLALLFGGAAGIGAAILATRDLFAPTQPQGNSAPPAPEPSAAPPERDASIVSTTSNPQPAAPALSADLPAPAASFVAPALAPLSDSQLDQVRPVTPVNSDRELVPLYWTTASAIFSDQPDPYNKQYADYVSSQNRRGSGDVQGAQTAILAVEGTVLGLLSSTGYGAILALAWQILNLIGQYALPPSEGGWEKLLPIQRQIASLYGLTFDFEPKRNQTVYESQKLDLSIPDPSVPSRPGAAPVATDPKYPLYIRNRLIRAAYAAEFSRVTQIADMPMLPAVLINILNRAKMWPPPLPPFHPKYFGEANGVQWKFAGYGSLTTPIQSETERQVAEVQYRILRGQYETDIRKFSEVSKLAIMNSEVLELAGQNGCIPELTEVGVFQFGPA